MQGKFATITELRAVSLSFLTLIKIVNSIRETNRANKEWLIDERTDFFFLREFCFLSSYFCNFVPDSFFRGVNSGVEFCLGEI